MFFNAGMFFNAASKTLNSDYQTSSSHHHHYVQKDISDYKFFRMNCSYKKKKYFVFHAYKVLFMKKHMYNSSETALYYGE